MKNFSLNFNFTAPFPRVMFSNSLLFNFNNTIGQLRNYHIFNPLKNINNKVPNENFDIQFKQWLIDNTPERIYLNSAECKDNIYKDNKNKSGIYLWFNTINDKYYIGSAQHLTRRFMQYYSDKYLTKTSLLIHKALIRHTHDKFSLYILEYCDIKDLIEREQYYIDLLIPQYNILKIAGSSLGFKHTLETLNKISVTKTGYKISEEHNKKRNDASKGENNPFYGKNHTIEVLTKLSMQKTGINNPMYGKTGKNNILSKKVYIYENNESPVLFKMFFSYTEAAKYFNCNSTTISRYVDKKRIYANKYILTSMPI
jgi:group I intron endonuclease